MLRQRLTRPGGIDREVPLILCGALALGAAAAHASGLAPITTADAIQVRRGGSVSVTTTGARSVLANDFDLEGDTLTASLAEAPRRGTVTLNPDGTFLYVHNGSAQQEDRFRYRAFDGTRYSRATDVNVTITRPGTPPRITGQRNLAVPEDGSLQIAITDFTVSDPDSRFPQDFSFTLSSGENYTLAGATVIPDPDVNGTLSIPARVNDGEYDSPVFLLRVVVTPVNDPPFVSAPLPARDAIEGVPLAIEVAGSFSDVDNDRLTFAAAGLPPSGTLRMDSATGRIAGTPLGSDARPQPYTVSVTARDTAGASVSTSFALRILPTAADLAVTAAVTPNPASAEAVPTWTLTITNRGARSSAGGRLVARWLAWPEPVTLDAPARCAVSGNGSEEVTLECAIEPLAPGTADSIAVQSSGPSPGDLAVLATVEVEDADPRNNTATASLNLAGSFDTGPAQSLAGAGANVATGDLDGDGLLDLVVGGGGARLYFGTPSRALDAGPTLGSASADVVALLDWNGDGRLDIATASRGTASGRVYLNDGNRRFSAGPALPTSSVAAAVVTDLNGDGTADLVLTGASGTRTIDRNGSTRVLHGAAARHLAAADVNGDGRADLAITDAVTRAVHLLTSTGSGFTYTVATLADHGSVASATFAHHDGDGAADLLLAIDGADYGSPANVVLRNTQSGFERALTFGQAATLELHAADVNADGYGDVVAINASGGHQVFLGDGQGGLTLQAELVLRPSAALGKLAPLDGDGFPDLLLAGPEQPSVGFYRNDGLGRFGRGDLTAPVISLLGPERLEIKVGESFADPGVTAIDDVEGDVSGRVQRSGTVNTAIVGTYTVTYQVADRSGNAATPVQRTVAVQAATGTSGGGGGAAGALWLALLGLATALSRTATRAGSRRAESAPTARRRSRRSSRR